jgi:hypothetical protein
MSDPMSLAELTEQHVELLPDRTVLSLMRAATGGSAGSPGEAGSAGANGKGIPGTTWMALLFPQHDAGSGTTSYGIGDATSTTH